MGAVTSRFSARSWVLSLFALSGCVDAPAPALSFKRIDACELRLTAVGPLRVVIDGVPETCSTDQRVADQSLMLRFGAVLGSALDSVEMRVLAVAGEEQEDAGIPGEDPMALDLTLSEAGDASPWETSGGACNAVIAAEFCVASGRVPGRRYRITDGTCDRPATREGSPDLYVGGFSAVSSCISE